MLIPQRLTILKSMTASKCLALNSHLQRDAGRSFLCQVSKSQPANCAIDRLLMPHTQQQPRLEEAW